MIGYILLFRKKLIVPKYLLSRNNMATNTSSVRKTPYGISIFTSVMDLSYYEQMRSGEVKNLITTTPSLSFNFATILPDGRVNMRKIDATEDRVREVQSVFKPADDLIVALAHQDNRIQVLETITHDFKAGEEHKIMKLMVDMFPVAGEYMVLDIERTAKKIGEVEPLPVPVWVKRKDKFAHEL